jgi:phosphatidylcholine synthase
LAWCVHLYTALGLLAAAGIAILIVMGGANAFRWAFVLMCVATIIDSTDGTFARWVRVKEVLPDFDGRRLDDLVDFLNYSFLPLLLLWRAEIPSPGTTWVLIAPLLASGYGFCQAAIKTDDGYFLGFPSFWNVVAFYLYVFAPASWISITLLLLLSLLTFVPSRYLYPSQPGWINSLTIFLGIVWGAFLALALWNLPVGQAAKTPENADKALVPAFLSLFFPVYYMIVSWGISVRHRRLKQKTEFLRDHAPST